jgi:hypothetical protein
MIPMMHECHFLEGQRWRFQVIFRRIALKSLRSLMRLGHTTCSQLEGWPICHCDAAAATTRHGAVVTDGLETASNFRVISSILKHQPGIRATSEILP